MWVGVVCKLEGAKAERYRLELLDDIDLQNIVCQRGASIKEALRGEGGLRIARFCGRAVLIGYVKCRQRGGGLKIPKFLLTD